MQKRLLGRAGLEVSEFCLGTLPMGPGQRNLPAVEAARIVRTAFEAGVNFFDTAQGYRTQPFLKAGLGADAAAAVIATKSPASDGDDVAADVGQALSELGRSHIDIMHLHAARDPEPFKHRAGALERLVRLKEEGVVKAIGISTHYICAVRQAAQRDELDVIHPLTNLAGIGIMDGTQDEMAAAIEHAAAAGKGVYVMKPLAGGNLLARFRQAIAYARRLAGVSAVALGVVSPDELAFDLRVFNDEAIDDAEFERTARLPKRYIVLGGCDGCGACLDACPADAIELVDGKARIDQDTCILCGYCALDCPGFWIRLA